MRTTINIIKSILIYSIFYLLINLLFCLKYYFIEFNTYMSFGETFILLLSGTLMNEIKEEKILMISNFQRFVQMILTTILTGYIFTYILNREPKIILPDKLTIRHRTSENVNHLLTLGVLVGNKSRHRIYDVQCIVLCTYLKYNDDPDKTNGEFQLLENIYVVDNYYRFSFKLEYFPKKMLEDFLDKNLRSLEVDTISISVSGHSKILGNSFLVTKKYKLTDLVIDEHTPSLTEKHKIKNPLTKRPWSYVKWNEFNKVEEVSESERAKTVDEIRKIIEKKFYE